MKPYFGKIEIVGINNKQIAAFKRKEADTVFLPLNENNIRFVHYPDCQQLIIWLTHPGREYRNIRLRSNDGKQCVSEWPVSEKLSGSIQILWDTLNIAPGHYIIEIEWKEVWQHQIEIEKLEEGITLVPMQAVITLTENNDAPSEPVQYRDGFGNIIENEDLILREKVIKGMARRFSRRIVYEGNFRAGTIIYIDNESRIEFYHEMGGGNCMFYIDIPTEEQWEAQTKTHLSARKEILEFVAATVQAQQASNCYYRIEGKIIGFYYK